MQLHWPIATPPELGADDAHVWAASLDGIETFDRALAMLSTDERARGDGFRFEPARRRFVITRAAVRVLLGGYLDERPEDVCLSVNAFDKPQLASKYAAASLRFNISHSGDLALVAVNLGGEVGIDVEQLRGVSHLEHIARRYFHQQEADAVLTATPDARIDAFFRCWTAKEAVLKAIGIGITSLDAFQAPLAPSFEGWIDVSGLPTPNRSSQCWLKRLAPCDGYLAAVAFLDHRPQLICRTLVI